MLKTSSRSFKNDFAVCKFLDFSAEQHLDIQVIQICVKDSKFVVFFKGEDEDVDKLNELFGQVYFES